jgi:hypothetical protein
MLPNGSRSHFGSLLVGYNSPDVLGSPGESDSVYQKGLSGLYGKFQRLKQPSCPFVNLPEKSRGRWVVGLRVRSCNAASGSNKC